MGRGGEGVETKSSISNDHGYDLRGILGSGLSCSHPDSGPSIAHLGCGPRIVHLGFGLSIDHLGSGLSLRTPYALVDEFDIVCRR